MPGVRHVDNQLEVYPRPEDIPGVDGPVPPRPSGPRWELMQRTWSPSARALVGTLGALLLVAAPRQNLLTAVGFVGAGTLALLRSLTNEPLLDRLQAASDAREQGSRSDDPDWPAERAGAGGTGRRTES
jgi:hypothetical protein